MCDLATQPETKVTVRRVIQRKRVTHKRRRISYLFSLWSTFFFAKRRRMINPTARPLKTRAKSLNSKIPCHPVTVILWFVEHNSLIRSRACKHQARPIDCNSRSSFTVGVGSILIRLFTALLSVRSPRKRKKLRKSLEIKLGGFYGRSIV